MQRWLALLLGLLATYACNAISSSPAPTPLKVLFIGNSYTYYHRLPDIVAAMSARPESPRKFEVRMVAQGGASLLQHWEGAGARRALRGNPWDVVVLQEHSQVPFTHPQQLTRYAERFAAEARTAGARTVLYVTWARRDRPEGQNTIADAYAAAAKAADADLAPVGAAWRIARMRWPALALHEEDGGHPSPTGAYLSACVLYIVLQPGARTCPALAEADRDDPVMAGLREVAAESAAGVRNEHGKGRTK
jgi:hypothetical protein